METEVQKLTVRIVRGRNKYKRDPWRKFRAKWIPPDRHAPKLVLDVDNDGQQQIRRSLIMRLASIRRGINTSRNHAADALFTYLLLFPSWLNSLAVTDVYDLLLHSAVPTFDI